MSPFFLDLVALLIAVTCFCLGWFCRGVMSRPPAKTPSDLR